MTYDPSRSSVGGYTYATYAVPVPRFTVPNKKIAIEPFPAGQAKAEVRGGVLAPINQAALTPLRVIFGSDIVDAESVVYVRSNLPFTTSYGKEIFEAEGKKFILVPETDVVLIDRGQ